MDTYHHNGSFVLYCLSNEADGTFSHPVLGPSIDEVLNAFTELNPENASDLRVHFLCEFKSLSDLLSCFKENSDPTFQTPQRITIRKVKEQSDASSPSTVETSATQYPHC